MQIVNQSDIDATWRCYDEKWALLAENTVSANGGKAFYDPPNASGQYRVNFWIGGNPGGTNNPPWVNVPAGGGRNLAGIQGRIQSSISTLRRGLSGRLSADPSGSGSNRMGVAIADGPGPTVRVLMDRRRSALKTLHEEHAENPQRHP
jgi:hypothetical protein